MTNNRPYPTDRPDSETDRLSESKAFVTASSDRSAEEEGAEWESTSELGAVLKRPAKTESEWESTAEDSAFEARLAQLSPAVPTDGLAQLKAEGLLLLCRQERRKRDPLSGPLLVKTIVSTGEERITLSLRHYVRQARLAAAFCGFCAGILVGAAGILFLVAHFAPGATLPARPPKNLSSDAILAEISSPDSLNSFHR